MLSQRSLLVKVNDFVRLAMVTGCVKRRTTAACKAVLKLCFSCVCPWILFILVRVLYFVICLLFIINANVIQNVQGNKSKRRECCESYCYLLFIKMN